MLWSNFLARISGVISSLSGELQSYRTMSRISVWSCWYRGIRLRLGEAICTNTTRLRYSGHRSKKRRMARNRSTRPLVSSTALPWPPGTVASRTLAWLGMR